MAFRTERDVARLKAPAGKASVLFFDEAVPGLAVRIQGERRTWVVRYGTAGKRRLIALGPVAGLTLADARKRAGDIIAGAKLGGDPLADRATAKAERERVRLDAERTFGRIADLYLKARQSPDPMGGKHWREPLRPRTLVEVTRALVKQAADLRPRPLGSITAADVKAALAAVSVSSGPVAASRLRTYLSAFFAWAIAKGYATANPAAEVPGGDASKPRERVLADREIAAIWHAAGERGAYGRIVRLLFLTAARRSEVGGMARSEIDLEAATWRLPADRAKNGRAHTVPLTPSAVAILKAALSDATAGEAEPSTPFVFGRRPRPSARSQGKGKPPGFSAWSQSKRRLDARSGIADWTLHDIRRTVATNLQRLGVRLEVAERILGHAATAGSRAGIVGVYQRHSFDDEARDALHRWADRLMEIVGEREPGAVVRLRA